MVLYKSNLQHHPTRVNTDLETQLVMREVEVTVATSQVEIIEVILTREAILTRGRIQQIQIVANALLLIHAKPSSSSYFL